MKNLIIFWLLLPLSCFGGSIYFSSNQILQGEPLLIEIKGDRGSFVYIEEDFLPIIEVNGGRYIFWSPDLDARVGSYDVCDEEGNELGIFQVADRPGETKEDTIKTEFEIKSEIVEKHFDSLCLAHKYEPLFSGKFVGPLSQMDVYSRYAKLRKKGGETWWHKGVDFTASIGTPIYSIGDGVVIEVGEFFRYGGTTVIDHGAGIISFYLHQSDFAVKKGDRVVAGQVIGATGNTGNVTGPHLHFGIRISGEQTDPLLFMEMFNDIFD
mgnify:FL=1